MGLVGGVGSLAVEYKKYLRDGKVNSFYKEQVSEDLGDILWYVASLANQFNLSLDDIAAKNIIKCADRWITTNKKLKFDSQFPSNERLPKKIKVSFIESIIDGKERVEVFCNGSQIGGHLTDNSYSSDGYRYHDVFHFSYAAILGWSVVTRCLLKVKRKSVPDVDEIEDGGRAIAIEEGVSALIFSYAKTNNFFKNYTSVDCELLKIIRNMISTLEVSACSTSQWETAILSGYKVWRQLNDNRGGEVLLDLENSGISYLGK